MYTKFENNPSRGFWVIALTPLRAAGGFDTETEMSSFWRNFNHWLHRKLPKWQLSVQSVIKISSKWQHFRFSGRKTITSPDPSDTGDMITILLQVMCFTCSQTIAPCNAICWNRPPLNQVYFTLHLSSPSKRAQDAIITSLWRQNDVATSFWRHNDVIIASCVRWDPCHHHHHQPPRSTVKLTLSDNHK